jgi:hypothetical protein
MLILKTKVQRLNTELAKDDDFFVPLSILWACFCRSPRFKMYVICMFCLKINM